MNKVLIITCCIILTACDKNQNKDKIKIDGKTYNKEEFAVYNDVNKDIKEIIVIKDTTSIGICVIEGDKDIVGYYSDIYNFFPMDSNNIKDILYKIEKDTTSISKITEKALMERLIQERETFPATL